MGLIDNDQNGIDLGDFIKLPAIESEVSLSRSAMVFVTAVLGVVAFLVLRPFNRRRR